MPSPRVGRPRGGADLQARPRLLDGGLTGVTGGDVAHRLRQTSDLPIIFVSGADSAEDIHSGFKLGADDYIVKPFDPEELSWRIKAVLRRTGHGVAQVFSAGDLVVDERSWSVARAGSPIAVTTIEFKLLSVLIRNCSRLVPTAQLVQQVWGYPADPYLLAVHMSSLRAKLEAHGPRGIHTVRGTGTSFAHDEDAATVVSVFLVGGRGSSRIEALSPTRFAAS